MHKYFFNFLRVNVLNVKIELDFISFFGVLNVSYYNYLAHLKTVEYKMNKLENENHQLKTNKDDIINAMEDDLRKLERENGQIRNLIQSKYDLLLIIEKVI